MVVSDFKKLGARSGIIVISGMRGENNGNGYGRRIALALSRGILMAASAGGLIFSGMI